MGLAEYLGTVQGQPISAQPPHVRRDFIKKVYTILSFQLLLTAAIGFGIRRLNSSTGQPWVLQNKWAYYTALGVTMATLLGVGCCCSNVARRFPTNYLFLLVVTLGIGTTTGFAASLYTADSVILALLATCAAFFALTAYACFTKTDFTGCGPYLFASLLAMIAFSFVLLVFSLITGTNLLAGSGLTRTLFSLAGVLLFSLFIVYDTQKIIGGSHKKHQFEVDDYVFAALNLYLDVINMFLFILSLMGNRSS